MGFFWSFNVFVVVVVLGIQTPWLFSDWFVSPAVKIYLMKPTMSYFFLKTSVPWFMCICFGAFRTQQFLISGSYRGWFGNPITFWSQVVNPLIHSYCNIWPRFGLWKYVVCRSGAMMRFLNSRQELIWTSLAHALGKDRGYELSWHYIYTPILQKSIKPTCWALGWVVMAKRRASMNYFRNNQFSWHSLYEVLVSKRPAS